MYGEKAVELVKLLTRENTEPIPPYNYDLVDHVINEMVILNAEIHKFV